jgi:hypothetical protein
VGAAVDSKSRAFDCENCVEIAAGTFCNDRARCYVDTGRHYGRHGSASVMAIELTEKLRASGVTDTYVIMLIVRDSAGR